MAEIIIQKLNRLFFATEAEAPVSRWNSRLDIGLFKSIRLNFIAGFIGILLQPFTNKLES